MKTGANYKDQNEIKRLEGEGLDCGEISDRLQIKVECVHSFMENPDDLIVEEEVEETELEEVEETELEEVEETELEEVEEE